MNQVTNELTNRDIALLVWLGVALVGALIYRPSREGIGSALKLLLFSKLGIGLLVLLAYEALVAFIFYGVGLWHWWMLKDAMFWLFGSAIILFFNASNAADEEHYFKKVALDSFKFAVILSFIINLYAFNLIAELILLPVVTIVAVLGVYVATQSEFKQVSNFINWVMATFGLLFIVYAIVGITTDFHGFATLKNLEDFLTPVVLTLTLLPLAYLLGLYSAYESVFVRVAMLLGSDRQLATYAKRQIMAACRFRVSRVGKFSKDFAYRIGSADSRAEVDKVVGAFRIDPSAQSREQAQRASKNNPRSA